MSSTYSTNLALELMATGDQSGVWGNTTNTNLGTLIEQAISGYVTQAITDGSGANTTITIPNGATGVARNMYIEMTGALTFSTTSLIVPANKKLYFIFNNTSGGFAVTVKVSGQTGVLVPNGKKVVLVSNGTDIVEASNQVVGAFGIGGTLTAAAINASGPITITATSGNAAGTLSKNSTYGLLLYGVAGSANDFVLLNSSGAEVLKNATGTQNLSVSGAFAVTGLLTATGGVAVTATSTQAAGSLSKNATYGLTVFGITGSTYDAVILAADSSVALGVTTGTKNIVLTGTLGVSDRLSVSGGTFSATASVLQTTYSSGTSRFYSFGADTSTPGAFTWYGYSSNAGAGDVRMSISSAGAVTIPGTLGVTGVSTFTGSLFPNTDLSADMGSAAKRFDTLYIRHLSVGTGVDPGLNNAGISGTLGVTGTTKMLDVTNDPSASGLGVWVHSNGSSNGRIDIGKTASGAVTAIAFYYSGAAKGSISFDNSSTTYNTTSDRDFKNDLGVVSTTTVLRDTLVHDFEWKGEGTPGRGVFAQEAFDVIPAAVKVGNDSDINEAGVKRDPWAVDYSKYVPDLIVGWQDHEARLAALQAKFQAYKAAHP